MLAKQELDLELCDFEGNLSIAIGAGWSELFEVVVCGVKILTDILSAGSPFALRVVHSPAARRS